MSKNSYAIYTEELTKEFIKRKIFSKKQEKVLAVNNLNLKITAGESVAFLGRNGSGKSTTIKMLCGILSPTKGASYVLGHKSGDKRANHSLGIIFGTRSQLWMHLTIRQSFNITAEIYDVTGKERINRIIQLAEIFEITHLLEERARTLSLGQRMRCEIVAALIHKPKILLADEPTIGLDVVAKSQFRESINYWQKETKTTFLLTSHDCFDVESLCQRAILIENGNLRYDGSLNGLKGTLESIRKITITLISKEDCQNLKWHGIKVIKDTDYQYTFEVDIKKDPIKEIINKIYTNFDEKIIDIKIQEVQLDEIIKTLFS